MKDLENHLYEPGSLLEVSSAASGDKVVNEDGTGDGILFENDDQWVTE